MTRAASVAEAIEGMIRDARQSIDVAIYRFNHPRLWSALTAAAKNNVQVRVVIDRKKFSESHSTQELFSSGGGFSCRLSSGRPGRGGKMHHKFAILDGNAVLTGSYNWTLESEDGNFENLAVLRDPSCAVLYKRCT